MLVESVTENMFAQAVALAQNGRMKSTVHCKDKSIFILNMDNTILIRFKAPQVFDSPISFFSNDYESPKILEEDGKLVFVTNTNGLQRKKVCPAPKMRYDDVYTIWESFDPDNSQSITLVKDMLPLLEDGLSHIEISKKVGEPVMLIQRDIYSGSRIEVKRNKSSQLLEVDDMDFSFNTIGIRTIDFAALFSFCESLTWYVQKGKKWVYFEDNTGRMGGILATCLYDEMGTIGTVK